MSKGVGGSAEILSENENGIIYKYYNYDLNVPENRNDKRIADGRIIINKNEISPSENDIVLLLEQGKILVENSKNSWGFVGKYDHIALSLLRRIMKCYENEKSFPQKMYYDV
ncbi:MAG: hypothetical protein K2O29_09280 [Ruminococcus sp.]|nr:hypothetical protein [Ruminococcus sp.]